jgi:hypothetical protein
VNALDSLEVFSIGKERGEKKEEKLMCVRIVVFCVYTMGNF